MQPAAATLLVFISMFAPGEQGGIRAFHLDPATGRLAAARDTTGLAHPFFMAVAPDRRTLYAVHAQRFGPPDPEEVTAWRIVDREGALEPLGRQSARGAATCFLAVDPTGRTLLLANYDPGSVAALPIKADGSLGPAASLVEHAGSSVHPRRQTQPHAHAIVPAPGGRFAFAADLGADRIFGYRLDAATATLTPGEPPFVTCTAGSGPRHLAFHPNGRHLYAIDELSNGVTVFDYDAERGGLAPGPTVSTLPDDFAGTSLCADLKITPDGAFLYATNRGYDSIAVFRIGGDGRLTRVEIAPSRGAGPQHLAITPDGGLLLCANMKGGCAAVFRIDRTTGRLAPLGADTAITSPACIVLVP